MSWQILMLISVVTYSFSILLQRILLKENTSDPKAFSALFAAITGLCIGVFGFMTADMRLPALGPILPNFVLMIVLYAMGGFLFSTALKHVEVSFLTILFSSRALFNILASTLFLHEGLQGKQFIGTFLILLSIVLVNLKSTKISFGKYAWVALLAALFYGVQTTNDRYLLQTFSLYPYVSLAFLLPAILLACTDRHIVKHMQPLLKKNMVGKLILSCAIYALSAITFFAALQISPNSSQVASVNVSSVILTVILGMVILKERGNGIKKVIGAVLSTIGLLLVV